MKGEGKSTTSINMAYTMAQSGGISDPDIRRQIRQMFDTMLRDNCQARQLHSDGSYTRVPRLGEAVNSQEQFCQQAKAQAPTAE